MITDGTSTRIDQTAILRTEAEGPFVDCQRSPEASSVTATSHTFESTEILNQSKVVTSDDLKVTFRTYADAYNAALMNPKEAKRLLCQPLLQLPDPSSTCSNTSAEPNDSDSSLQRASPVRIIDHASSYKSPHKTHADPQACDDGWHRLFQKAVVQSRHPPPEHRVDIFSPSSTKPVEIQGRYKSDVQPGKPRMHRTRHFGNAEQARPERRSNDPVLHEFEDDSVYREIAALIKRGQEALESQECQVEYSRARSGRRPLTSRSNSPHKGSPAASSQCSSSYNSPRRCRRESHEIRKLNVTPVKMYTEDTEIDGQSPFLREEMARARERYLARRK